MAFTERMATRTYTSGSAVAQFTFVSLAADGQVDNTSANARTDGVALMAATGAGEAITVAYDGRVTVQAGGTINRGAAVAVGTSGKAKAAGYVDSQRRSYRRTAYQPDGCLPARR